MKLVKKINGLNVVEQTHNLKLLFRGGNEQKKFESFLCCESPQFVDQGWETND